jgi:hypothetical protein
VKVMTSKRRATISNLTATANLLGHIVLTSISPVAPSRRQVYLVPLEQHHRRSTHTSMRPMPFDRQLQAPYLTTSTFDFAFLVPQSFRDLAKPLRKGFAPLQQLPVLLSSFFHLTFQSFDPCTTLIVPLPKFTLAVILGEEPLQRVCELLQWRRVVGCLPLHALHQRSHSIILRADFHLLVLEGVTPLLQRLVRLWQVSCKGDSHDGKVPCRLLGTFRISLHGVQLFRVCFFQPRNLAGCSPGQVRALLR